MNTDTSNENSTDNSKQAVAETLRAVGTAWARYGLTVGRAALESGARSLQVTATALGQLAEVIDNRPQTQNAPEVKDDRTTIVQSGG